MVFDVLGTLLDEDGGRLAAAEEVVGAPAVQLVARWEELSQAATLAMRERRRPYAVAEAVSAEAVAAAAAEMGERLTEAQVARLVGSGRQLEPFPEVADTLRRLAPSLALVALTNAGTAQAHAMSRSAGLRWTSLVSGETIGAYKPDPRMYEHLVRALDLDVRQCVFVAAHPWDLDAAARHGFRTAYVDRASSSPDLMAAYARRFDHVAADLTSLARLLSMRDR
nr:haloacid dehalogenase type II [Nocardioides lijunqiniae]